MPGPRRERLLCSIASWYRAEQGSAGYQHERGEERESPPMHGAITVGFEELLRRVSPPWATTADVAIARLDVDRHEQQPEHPHGTGEQEQDRRPPSDPHEA